MKKLEIKVFQNSLNNIIPFIYTIYFIVYINILVFIFLHLGV